MKISPLAFRISHFGFLVWVFIFVLLGPSPAGAQFQIFLKGGGPPIEASGVFDEGYWLVFREPRSGDELSIAKERVDRVVGIRPGGYLFVPFTPPPSLRLAGAQRAVLLQILNLEDKRFDTLVKGFHSDIQNLSTLATAKESVGGQSAELAIGYQRDIIRRKLDELGESLPRIDRILDRMSQLPTPPVKPIYHFYR